MDESSAYASANQVRWNSGVQPFQKKLADVTLYLLDHTKELEAKLASLEAKLAMYESTDDPDRPIRRKFDL